MVSRPPADPTEPDAELLEMPDVARRLKVSEWTARELGRTGQLPIVRIGRIVRVRLSTLKRFIEDREK